MTSVLIDGVDSLVGVYRIECVVWRASSVYFGAIRPGPSGGIIDVLSTASAGVERAWVLLLLQYRHSAVASC